MDSFVIKAITDELRSWICPGLVKKIVQTDIHTLWIKVKGKKTDWLVISTKNPFPGLYFTPDKPNQSNYDTPFGMTLSKNLSGGKIIEIKLEELERIVQFEIIPYKAGYPLKSQILIAELFDHNACMILMESDSHKILACSKQIQNRNRRILPGELYQPFLQTDSQNPFKMTDSDFRKLFANYSQDVDLPRFLVHNLIGLSPQIAEEIVFRAGLSRNSECLNDFQIERLWKGLQEILSEYGSSHPHPVVITDYNHGAPPILSSFPLESKKGKGTEKAFLLMNDAADYFYGLVNQICKFQRLNENLKKIIKKFQKKYKQRLTNLEKDMEKIDEAERSKYYGDLLMANLQSLTKGMNQINLQDLYDEKTIVTIPLDPAKNAVQNAQSYFKQYRKARRGLDVVRERKAKTEESLHRLNKAEHILTEAKDQNAFIEIEDLLKGILPNRERTMLLETSDRPTVPGRKARKSLTGIRSFEIKGGWEALVGKTDKDNDRLTREVAMPEDIWLHVYDAPGSHVILKNPGRLENIPPNVLREAACIAAFFSRQRDEKKVWVGYTRKKYIRKPKGMKPGQVIIINKQKTILVEPSLDAVTMKEK